MIDYKGNILIREELHMDNYYSAVGAGIGTAYYLFILVFYIACVIGMWKMFEKADKPGWASLIPFYNLYCVYDIGWGTGWLFLLTFVPCVGFIFDIMLSFKMAKAYGQGTGFGFGILFLKPIFYMILGFGDSEYIGPQ